jgi:transposase
MASWNPKHDRATIDRAVSMVTGGEGRPKRTLREVADELGVSHVTVHKWVYRTARQVTASQYDPLREPDHEDPQRPYPNRMPTALASADQTDLLTELIDHHRREGERLARENAALKTTVVLLLRDLDERT